MWLGTARQTRCGTAQWVEVGLDMADTARWALLGLGQFRQGRRGEESWVKDGKVRSGEADGVRRGPAWCVKPRLGLADAVRRGSVWLGGARQTWRGGVWYVTAGY